MLKNSHLNTTHHALHLMYTGLQRIRQEKKSVGTQKNIAWHYIDKTSVPSTSHNVYSYHTASCQDTAHKVMDWVDAPVGTADITLRTGDGVQSKDAKTFTPGEILTLHIRVLQFHMKW